MTKSTLELIEETLNFVSYNEWNSMEENFRNRLAGFLCNLFDIEYVLISQYAKDTSSVLQTVLIYNRGKILPNFSYEFQNKPCKNVLGHTLCTYPTNVQNLFPQDDFLKQMDMDSYIGIPLWSTNHNPIGLIEIMDRKPINEIKNFEFVLQIVSLKVAQELEKNFYESKLLEAKIKFEEREKAYKDVVETTNDLITVVDNYGNFIFVNHASIHFYGLSPNDCLGRSAFEFIHPDDVAYTKNKFTEWINSSSNNFYFENRQMHTNGSFLYVAWSIHIERKDTEILKVTSIAKDISTQKRLEIEQTKLADIVKKSLNEIYIFDSITLKFEFVNEAALDNIGYSLDEMTSLTPVDIEPEFTEKQFRDSIYPLISGEMENLVFTTVHRRKNQTDYQVEVHLQLFKQKNKSSFFAIINDISERVKKEQELITAKKKAEENEKILNITGEIAMVGGWEIDLKNLSLTWTKEVFRIHEVDDTFIPTVEKAISFYDNVSLPIIQSAVNEAIEKGIPFNKELGIVTAKGNHKIVRALGKIRTNSNGDAEYVFGTFQDITEIKKIEQELIFAKEKAEENEERLRKYFEQGLIGMAITSLEKGWIEANNAICEYLGYSKEELFQKTWTELTHPDDLEPDIIQFNRLINGEIDGYKMDKRFIHKNGDIVYTELSVRCRFDKNSKPEYMLALINNITERKHNELLLKETNKSLEEMVYIASHDLQVPLVSMEGYATELLENYSDKVDEEGKYCLTRLQANAQRMHKLVLSLLDISRLNTKKNPYEKFNLESILKKIIQDLSLTIEKQHAIIKFGEMPDLFADKGRIETVFRNLISNSLNYGGKNISIGFENQCLYVKDDGMGVPASQLERIFNAGERLKKNNADGVGMGLTFCRKVIELHKGKIWAESDGENKGTTFYIKF